MTTKEAFKAPPGFRFLVNLTEAKDAGDAREMVRRMFGSECALVAAYHDGSYRIRPDNKPGWIRQKTGCMVFVPLDWRLGGGK